MCTLFPGFCPTDDDDESVNSWTKRDTEAVSSTYERPSSLRIAKRGAAKTYAVTLGKAIIEIGAAAYPSIGDLYTGPNVGQVLRTGFKLTTTYCTGPGLATTAIPSGMVTGLNKNGFETEHPLDVCPLPCPFHPLNTRA